MIYFIQADSVGGVPGNIKIGFTAEDANYRASQLQTGSPVRLTVLKTMPGDMLTEKDLHRQFAAYKVHGDWFSPVPEVLEAAGAPKPKQVGANEIVTKSVQIKVLTVGRRQFTDKMLSQMPVECPINWNKAYAYLRAELVHGLDNAVNAAWESDVLHFMDVDYWGWINRDHCSDGSYFVLIFEREGVLYKCPVRERNDYSPEPPEGKEMSEAVGYFWHRCFSFLTRQQFKLFIGV